MSKDIPLLVSTCEACNKNKKPVRHPRTPMTSYQAGAPMERVHLDFLGPLPKTPAGNEHVLVMVDQFTKWVECIPLPSQTAEVTAQAAITEFFSRFGYPFELHTDQGRNFRSQLFSSVCELLQIHKTRTTAYRPSANGQVERFNRTLMNAVRCYVGKNAAWDKHLGQISGAIRASVNRHTGFTPNRMMLGRELNLPSSLMFEGPGQGYQGPNEYVQELEGAISSAHQKAREQLKVSQKKMKKDYDLRVLEKTYEVGDPVYILEKATPKGKSRKLCPPWRGPGIVVKKLSPSLFKVKISNQLFTINHDRLKKCKDQSLPAWIQRLRKNPEALAREGLIASGTEVNYCICKGKDDGRAMIQCDQCMEWFHCDCVGMSANRAKRLDRYECPNCTVGSDQ